MSSSRSKPHVMFAAGPGPRLRALRRERGLTIADLAERSGGALTAGAIGAYERGDRPLTAGRLLRLAEILAVSPSEILAGENRRTKASSVSVCIDLHALDQTTEREAVVVRNYVDWVLEQRGDEEADFIALRGEDLSAIGASLGVESGDVFTTMVDFGFAFAADVPSEAP